LLQQSLLLGRTDRAEPVSTQAEPDSTQAEPVFNSRQTGHKKNKNEF
jgi:hypothetical protein